MRWRIRYQLLVPPLLLLCGVVGVSVWTAEASAQRARQRVERRVREMAQNLEKSTYPLDKVLEQIKLYSGADFVFVSNAGDQEATLAVPQPFTPPADAVSSNAAAVTLGPRVVVGDKSYLCSGLRLLRQGRGDTIYILY